MRYTLRLLTIQQFQRAAALICACETIRREDTVVWGASPFRIGLWVGARVTPNRTDDARGLAQAAARRQAHAVAGGGLAASAGELPVVRDGAGAGAGYHGRHSGPADVDYLPGRVLPVRRGRAGRGRPAGSGRR